MEHLRLTHSCTAAIALQYSTSSVIFKSSKRCSSSRRLRYSSVLSSSQKCSRNGGHLLLPGCHSVLFGKPAAPPPAAGFFDSGPYFSLCAAQSSTLTISECGLCLFGMRLRNAQAWRKPRWAKQLRPVGAGIACVEHVFSSSIGRGCGACVNHLLTILRLTPLNEFLT